MAPKETRLERRIKLNLNMEQNCRMWGTKNIGTAKQNMNAKETIKRDQLNLNVEQSCRMWGTNIETVGTKHDFNGNKDNYEGTK
jgi:hypothetical protein